MDQSASAMIGQGNTYLSEMGEQGREIRRHNQQTKDTFATAITTAQATGGAEERRGKMEKYSQGFSQIGSDLGARALAIQKAGGVSEYVKDFPIVKGAGMMKEGGEQVVSALRGATAPAPATASSLLDQMTEGGRFGMAGAHAQLPSGAMASGRMLTPGAGFVARGGAGVPSAIKPAMKLGAKASGVGADVEEGSSMLGKLGKGVEGIGKLSKGAGIISGAMGGIEDIASGKIVGANNKEKTGNELGLVSAGLDLLSFVPGLQGLGIIGGALGLASGAESTIGESEETKKKTTQTLPSEEKSQMEAPVKAPTQYASTGMVSSSAQLPTAKIGTAGAF